MRHHSFPARALALSLAISFSMGCASTAVPTTIHESTPVYRVGSPDELYITVLPPPAIERELVVRPDGMISFDLVGEVQATGRTVAEISEEIERRLSKYRRDPHVTVVLGASRSRSITILGEVQRPATIILEKETRVAEALGRVSGPTSFGARDRIRVVRHLDGVARVFDVDLKAIEAGDSRTNIMLQGGDLVVVPPTALASVGYAIAHLLFPFSQLFGATRQSTTVVGAF